MWTLEFYETPAGERPAQAFLDGLAGIASTEAIACLRLVLERGATLRLPHSRALGRGLFELRGRTSGVRLFYVFRPGSRIVLLDGLVKRRDDIPAAFVTRLRRLQGAVGAL